jgi:hypothetical protein
MLQKADRRTATTKIVRETEAEAIAFVINKAAGLETGTALSRQTQRCWPKALKSSRRHPLEQEERRVRTDMCRVLRLVGI